MEYPRSLMSIRLQLCCLVAALLTPIMTLNPVAAQTTGDPVDRQYVEIAGHGWGHGRGLGQYGAQGYALDDGWTSEEILDHYYGETTAGTASSGTTAVNSGAVRIEIRNQRDAALKANVGTGILAIRDTNGTDLALIEPGKTVRLSLNGANIRLETSDSCGGTFAEVFLGGPSTVEIVALSEGGGTSDKLLRVCHDDGLSTWYDGTLRFVNNGGLARTVNVASIESYLRGVLPAEVPSSWMPAALQSQAVAARSYALAGDTRQHPYADTCDTTSCQVYRGRFRRTDVTGFTSSTSAATDTAIGATAGLVRLRDGGIARTEFSSSTGGYTAGGDFPSVVDDGDNVASNPNHNWSKTVDLTSWIVTQGQGRLLGMEADGNGLGVDGGRVLSVRFVFERGTVVLSGNQVRQTFGLKSDWFTFGPLSSTGSSANDSFVVAAFQLFLQRSPTIEERVDWTRQLNAGVDKQTFTQQLASSAEWAGVMIVDLYETVLDRPADEAGRAYWLGQMANGLRFEAVAAHFYGAPEYFQRAGGTSEGFVSALYTDILGRAADNDGRNYWAGRLDRDIDTPNQVAAGFYASPESRRDRVTQLYRDVLGRDPDPAGLGYWASRLLLVDDVQLAALLGSSLEFFSNAQ
jgi:SpoIID/LytB domain protein